MRQRGLVAVIAATVLISCLGSAAGTAAADTGYQGPSFSGTSTPTGTKRAESVLWRNDGSWWASMWHTASGDFHIFRLDGATQKWIDTGVPIDTRSNTSADVLWDGTHLYVASHRALADGQPAVSGYPSYLFRYSYDRATKRYTRDTGFPVAINNMRTETLVIDKDSTGKLWATWQQGNRIYVNRTSGSDTAWGTAFALPVTGTNVTVDDTSAVISFAGNQIGVMWSNASSANDAMYFAVHQDGQPDTTWQASRTAIQGPGTADDHINLKSLQSDSSGRVFAAVKTSFTSSSAPLIMLLVRDRATGNWSSHPVARVSDCPNRPIAVIDETNRLVHVFATYPGPPAYACNSSGGAIYQKTSPLSSISFPSGRGTPVIVDDDSPFVHNVTSSKQNVNSGTGIAVLAVNMRTAFYWHAFQPVLASPTFSASASPTSRTVTRGQSATYAVTITPANGFSGSVSLSASGLPSGATSSFSPNPVSVSSSPASSTLRVGTSSTTARGTYTLTIRAASGSIVRTIPVTLQIQ
jgi:hypothetical protein